MNPSGDKFYSELCQGMEDPEKFLIRTGVKMFQGCLLWDEDLKIITKEEEISEVNLTDHPPEWVPKHGLPLLGVWDSMTKSMWEKQGFYLLLMPFCFFATPPSFMTKNTQPSSPNHQVSCFDNLQKVSEIYTKLTTTIDALAGSYDGVLIHTKKPTQGLRRHAP
jgi:hypothetical protein